jgi:hypothetical protein
VALRHALGAGPQVLAVIGGRPASTVGAAPCRLLASAAA